MLSEIITQEEIVNTREKINNSTRIVIVSHISPDGDAIGSSLGLCHYLRSLGKEVNIVVPNAFPAFLSWMPESESICIYNNKPETGAQIIKEADLLFALDFNTLKRIEYVADAVNETSAYKILIDHHLYPDDCFQLIISYPQISSTSELIFRLIYRLGDIDKINKAVAECIYTGMMTDTGSFTYNSNNPEIYEIISLLIAKGINKDEIFAKVYNNYSADRFRLQGRLLSEYMTIYDEYPAVLMTLTGNVAGQYNYQAGDSEGFVNIPLSIKGIVLSVFMREDPDKIKISLRSSGTFPCNELAARYFGGGGHLNASGGEFYGTLKDAVKTFEEALSAFKKEFNI